MRATFKQDAPGDNYFRRARNVMLSEYPDSGDDAPKALIDAYTLLALTKGERTTMEDVHDAWSLATDEDNPRHDSLKPYAQLTTKIQEYDRPYMESIHRTARGLNKYRSNDAQSGRSS